LVHHRGHDVSYSIVLKLAPTRIHDGRSSYPAVKEIISIFGGNFSMWGIASWFAGSNGFLDDQRPLDLLDEDPDWVVEAARDATDGMTHAECLDDAAHGS
jgi:hypothetical protein